MTVNDLLDALVILQRKRTEISAESDRTYMLGNTQAYINLNTAWVTLTHAIERLLLEVQVRQAARR